MGRLPIYYGEPTSKSLSNSNKHLAVHSAVAIIPKKDSIRAGEWAECVARVKDLANMINMPVRCEGNSGERVGYDR